jgi:transglutaminase-like putative cysteine protease
MPKLEEGWLTVALLGGMMVVAAGGVAAAGWTEHLHVAWITGLLGIVAGLALAKSRFSGSSAVLFATVYGLFAVGLFIGMGLQGTWHERSVAIIVRLNNFLYTAIHGGTSRDPLPFPVTISLIFWYIGVLNAWSVFRRGSVWPAIIPAGIGLLVNAYYYLGPVRLDLYLAVYVLLALMFVARMNLLAREREWQSARVLYSPDLRLDFLRAGLAAALVGVLVAWAAPSLAASPQAATTWRQMTGSFSFVRESWMRMFAAIRGYGQAYNDFYGDSLPLSGASELSNEPIMDVRVLSVSRDDERFDDVLGPILRFYWAANAYAVYDGGSWRQGSSEFKEYDPNRTRLQQPAYQQRRQATMAVTMHTAASSRLYAAPMVQWVDRPLTLEITHDPAGGHDILNMRTQGIIRRGETYQVISSVTVADSDSLREAGMIYPGWVLDNYLQLPDNITPRTRALAQQIVDEAGAITPYDRAEAITHWLRRNITYNQLIDAPPPGVEPVDYFLFETRTGYCNYYASAQVVMLRSLGIPARLAVGMAQGTLDPRSNTYYVLEENAHAWPEVFFPGYGWVEFEPTVSEEPLVRPDRLDRSGNFDMSGMDNLLPGGGIDPVGDRFDNPLPDDFFPDDFSEQGGLISTSVINRVPWLPLLAGAGVVILLLAVGGLVSFRLGMVGWESLGSMGGWVLKRRGLRLPSAVGAIYVQLERVARWLGLAEAESVTPYERAAALSDFVPQARLGIDAITEQYVAEQYSPRNADVAAAARAWRSIRLKLWHDAVREYLLAVLEDEPLPDENLLRLKYKTQALSD